MFLCQISSHMPFITFEGIDGSGKSSILRLLSERLRALGHKVETTQEPGGTVLGRELREILLRTSGTPPCPETELLIYEADRAQHVKTKIKPLLKDGVWVFSDRYYDSSLAFQGAGRNIKKSDVAWLNEFASMGLKPDMTVLVDCTVGVGKSRMANRELDRFELEKKEFHEKVRAEYLLIAAAESKRFFVLNSEKTSPEDLAIVVFDEIKKRGLL